MADALPEEGGATAPPPMQWPDPGTQQGREQMQKMLQTPEGQRIAQNPEVQAQLKGMAAMMQSKEFQARIKEIQEDPEIKNMFADINRTIKEKGMAGIQEAMRKYMYNNPDLMRKLGEKVGDLPAKA